MIQALSRTLLLMRGELQESIADETLLSALTSTRVVLMADQPALATHSGQSAIVATALNLARCGHEVWLCLDDAPLVGSQPPLHGSHIVSALLQVGGDLLPGWNFLRGQPGDVADLAIAFGTPSGSVDAKLSFSVNATDWSAEIMPFDRRRPWTAKEWPIGALAAGALAAGEAFKTAMRKLVGYATASQIFNELYAPASVNRIELAPEGMPCVPDLGTLEIISSGAIANALLFSLLRLPHVTGTARVFDDDESALSNLNRNALLLRSQLERLKVDDLASFSSGLSIYPMPIRYGRTVQEEVPLLGKVLVGVDDIPSRWKVQERAPEWIGVGATDRFSVQVSYHDEGLPCVRCLHPDGSPSDGPIATVSFVSYWSGLILAVILLRRLAGLPADPSGQQVYFSPLRPESWQYSSGGVGNRAGCPLCGALRAAA